MRNRFGPRLGPRYQKSRTAQRQRGRYIKRRRKPTYYELYGEEEMLDPRNVAGQDL